MDVVRLFLCLWLFAMNLTEKNPSFLIIRDISDPLSDFGDQISRRQNNSTWSPLTFSHVMIEYSTSMCQTFAADIQKLLSMLLLW